MKDFFVSIEGLSSENLTTEILAQILISREFAAYQRLFFSHIFQENCLKSTEEYGYEVTTQMDFKELGRPDLVIYNTNSVFLIENKFYAPYSNENQISRYIEILNTHFSNYSRKEIFLLTIKRRLNHYEEKISKDLILSNTKVGTVKLNYLLWDDILKIFASTNFVVNNLAYFIQTRFLTSIELDPKEIEMLNNNNYPQALNKIFNLIPLIKDIILKSYTVQRTSQSYNYYGFYIEQGLVKSWFGYFFPLWLTPIDVNVCTPLHLQIREEWITNGVDLTKFNNELSTIGFVKHNDFHWVKPYDLKLLSSKDSSSELNYEKLAQVLMNDLEKVQNVARP
ncbi:MAG: PD-(D/E)XK nuclease family protein [Ignavibacteria bacterium]|jgi:hypothetical protein|nr:PD-(D/E)XK nuclease family protein [Ignavibacteria bacterium]MCU7521164.1 PD-(D/E)XK nuclease family protein [Ignavibacteria bacterium]